MGKLVSAAIGLGRSNREISKMKTASKYRKAITQDISSTLGQLANIADDKAVETENFQAGEKLLQESDSFQKIEDVTEFSWKNPKSWGKQEGYQYNDRQYDREQVMTLGESFKSYGGGFDESQKANLMSNWESMNKDKTTFVGESKVGDSTESAYQKSLKRSNELGDKNRLLADGEGGIANKSIAQEPKIKETLKLTESEVIQKEINAEALQDAEKRRNEEYQKIINASKNPDYSGQTDEQIEESYIQKQLSNSEAAEHMKKTSLAINESNRTVTQDKWRNQQHIETPILNNIDTVVNNEIRAEDQAYMDLQLDDDDGLLTAGSMTY